MDSNSNIDTKFNQFIRSVKPDEPPNGFTEFIMNEIHNDAQNFVNPKLNLLLQRAIIEKPTSDFTVSTMNKIKIESHKVANEPIISKKTWIVTILTITFFGVLLGDVSQSSDLRPTLAPFFFGKVFDSMFKFITVIPSLYVLAPIAIAILSLTDYFISSKFSDITKKP
jgi:hypothetical protein